MTYYTVSGAGGASWNGVYGPIGTYNGSTLWQKVGGGSFFMGTPVSSPLARKIVLSSNASDLSSPAYFSPVGQSGSGEDPTAVAWQVSSGNSPAPTVTVYTPLTAQSYKYLISAADGVGYHPVSEFSLSAENLYDNNPGNASLGDTTTGYQASADGTSHARVYALIDLGTSPPVISEWRFSYLRTVPPNIPPQQSTVSTVALFYSDDGTNWTQADSQVDFNYYSNPPPPVLFQRESSLSSIRAPHRYWQAALVSGNNDAGYALNFTDLRLIDTNGVPIAGPNSTPAPTAALTPASQSIVYGQSATLSVATTNTTWATIDGGVGDVTLDGSGNGSATASPADDTTYTLSVTGPGGTATSSASVAVAPDRPGSFAASIHLADTTKADLSWTSPAMPGATVSVYKGAAGAETLLASGLTTTSYQDSGLTPGTSISYYVKADKGSKHSAASPEVTLSVPEPQIRPAIPQGMTRLALATEDTPTSLYDLEIYNPAGQRVFGVSGWHGAGNGWVVIAEVSPDRFLGRRDLIPAWGERQVIFTITAPIDAAPDVGYEVRWKQSVADPLVYGYHVSGFFDVLAANSGVYWTF